MPLRPELYRRLVYVFGEVRVVNEGQEMDAEIEEDPCCPGEKRLRIDSYGESYAVSCAFCTDTRLRLYIRHRWNLYVPALRSWNIWLAKCFNEDCLANYNNQAAPGAHGL